MKERDTKKEKANQSRNENKRTQDNRKLYKNKMVKEKKTCQGRKCTLRVEYGEQPNKTDKEVCEMCRKDRLIQEAAEAIHGRWSKEERPEKYEMLIQGITIKELVGLSKDLRARRRTHKIVRVTRAEQLLCEAIKKSGHKYVTDTRRDIHSLTHAQAHKTCECRNTMHEGAQGEWGVCYGCMGQKHRRAPRGGVCTLCMEDNPQIYCGGCGRGWHDGCQDHTAFTGCSYLCRDCSVKYSREFHIMDDAEHRGRWWNVVMRCAEDAPQDSVRYRGFCRKRKRGQ